MTSHSSVMNRAQMFEAPNPDEPVSAARPRRLSQAPKQRRHDSRNEMANTYPAPKPAVAGGVDWPHEDDGGIPAPSHERGYRGHAIDHRDDPPVQRLHHAPGSPRSARSQGTPIRNPGGMRDAPPSYDLHHQPSPIPSQTYLQPSPRPLNRRHPHPAGPSNHHRPSSPRSSNHHRPSSPRSSNHHHLSSPRSSNQHRPSSPRSSTQHRPQSPQSSQSRRPQSPGSKPQHRPQSPRSSNRSMASNQSQSTMPIQSHHPQQQSSNHPQSTTKPNQYQSPRKLKPKPRAASFSGSDRRDDPPLQSLHHAQPSPASTRSSRRQRRSSPSISSAQSSQTSQHRPASATKERRGNFRSQDENSNPVENAAVMVGWPSEKHARNPIEHGQPDLTPSVGEESRSSDMSNRLRKIRTKPHRRSPSPSMMRGPIQHSNGEHDDDLSSARRVQSGDDTKLRLNDVLKRNLDGASAVLQEERASSVATSSSSLSSDELSNIAKRALQSAHLKSVSRDTDNDDGSVISMGSRASASSARSRLSRYSAARQRTANNRRRTNSEDMSVTTSDKSNRSGPPSVPQNLQNQQNRYRKEDSAGRSDDFSVSSENRRPALPRGVPRREHSPARDVQDDVSVTSQSSRRSQRMGQRLTHLQATERRRSPSPQLTRTSGVYSARSPSKDVADDVSVASQSSIRSERMSKRLSHIEAISKRRSPQVKYTAGGSNTPSSSCGKDVSDEVSISSQSSIRSELVSKKLSHIQAVAERRTSPSPQARLDNNTSGASKATTPNEAHTKLKSTNSSSEPTEDTLNKADESANSGSAQQKIYVSEPQDTTIGSHATFMGNDEPSASSNVQVSVTVASSQNSKSEDRSESPLVSPRAQSPRARDSARQAVFDAAERSRSMKPKHDFLCPNDNCEESVVSVSSTRSTGTAGTTGTTGTRSGRSRREVFEKANNKKRLPISVTPSLSLELRKAEELRKRAAAQRANSISPGRGRLSTHPAFAGKSPPTSPVVHPKDTAQAAVGAWYSKAKPKKPSTTHGVAPLSPKASGTPLGEASPNEELSARIYSVGLEDSGGSKPAASVASSGTDVFEEVIASEKANLDNVQAAVNAWYTRTKKKPHIHNLVKPPVEYPPYQPKPRRERGGPVESHPSLQNTESEHEGSIVSSGLTDILESGLAPRIADSGEDSAISPDMRHGLEEPESTLRKEDSGQDESAISFRTEETLEPSSPARKANSENEGSATSSGMTDVSGSIDDVLGSVFSLESDAFEDILPLEGDNSVLSKESSSQNNIESSAIASVVASTGLNTLNEDIEEVTDVTQVCPGKSSHAKTIPTAKNEIPVGNPATTPKPSASSDKPLAARNAYLAHLEKVAPTAATIEAQTSENGLYAKENQLSVSSATARHVPTPECKGHSKKSVEPSDSSEVPSSSEKPLVARNAYLAHLEKAVSVPITNKTNVSELTHSSKIISPIAQSHIEGSSVGEISQAEQDSPLRALTSSGAELEVERQVSPKAVESPEQPLFPKAPAAREKTAAKAQLSPKPIQSLDHGHSSTTPLFSPEKASGTGTYVSPTLLASHEKSLASRNAYLAHLEQASSVPVAKKTDCFAENAGMKKALGADLRPWPDTDGDPLDAMGSGAALSSPEKSTDARNVYLAHLEQATVAAKIKPDILEEILGAAKTNAASEPVAVATSIVARRQPDQGPVDQNKESPAADRYPSPNGQDSPEKSSVVRNAYLAHLEEKKAVAVPPSPMTHKSSDSSYQESQVSTTSESQGTAVTEGHAISVSGSQATTVLESQGATVSTASESQMDSLLAPSEPSGKQFKYKVLQPSNSDSQADESEEASHASSLSVQRLLAAAGNKPRARQLFAEGDIEQHRFDDKTDSSEARSQSSPRRPGASYIGTPAQVQFGSQYFEHPTDGSTTTCDLCFSESDNESAISIMSKNNTGPRDEGRTLLPDPLPEDQSVHYDDEKSAAAIIRDPSDSQTLDQTDNEGSTLIGQLHTNSKEGSTWQTENEGSTLIGQLHVDSKELDDMMAEDAADIRAEGDKLNQAQPPIGDTEKLPKASRATKALSWWQKKYSRNQDQNVNEIVENSLTPISVTMAAKQESKEASQINNNNTEKQSERSEMDYLKGTKSNGVYSDEESVFSGLDDLTRSPISARSPASSIASPRQEPEGRKILSPAFASSALSTEPKAETTSGKSSTAKKLRESQETMAPPAPPPQEHFGEVLDESQLVDTVNSDITSSVIAAEGANHPVDWSQKSSLVITEEMSDDIAAENDTMKSSSEDHLFKASLRKTKSHSSRESSKKSQKSKEKKHTAKPVVAVVKSTAREKKATTVNPATRAKTSTQVKPATRKTATKEVKSTKREKTATKQTKSTAREIKETRDMRPEVREMKPEVREMKQTLKSENDEPYFAEAASVPPTEDDTLFGSTVFMKIGAAILDTFETVCRMPDDKNNAAANAQSSRFDSQFDVSDAHSIAESAMSQSTLNDREAKKWDEWDRRETQSVFTPNTDAESRLTGEGSRSQFTTDFQGNESRTAVLAEDSNMNVYGRQAVAHQKLIKYTQNAMSMASSQDTDDSRIRQSGAETSAFDSSSDESSYSEHSAEDVRVMRTKPQITVITASIPSNRAKPPPQKTSPKALSLNQSRILEKFCSSMKSQGMEVLKQNRDNKWQVRHLTVSKEMTEIKYVKLTNPGNKGGTSGSCPSAILWLKRFNPKSKEYSTALIDKHGKGGVHLSQLVKVTATGRSDPAEQLPKKLKEKYKESVTVIMEYNLGGTIRTMALRCKTTEEAHFLCTGMRVCMDVLRRDEEANAASVIL